MIIEISPNEGYAMPCTNEGDEIKGSEYEADMRDCTAPGDAQAACEYVLDTHKPVFRIVAKNAAGKYENRLATDDEKKQTCETIYFESGTDFSDMRMAEIYLIWQAASDLEVGE